MVRIFEGRHVLMDQEMIREVVERRCPFAARAGMRVVLIGPDRVELAMEETGENLNAFGLVHAGAICGLAETAAGIALFRHLDPSRVLVLNTVLNIRFTHPPRGRLTAAVRVLPEEAAALMEEFEEKGRADKALDVKVFDSAGNMVAQAQATFRLVKPRPEFTGAS